MSKPLVSVIIPVYNQEKYIAKAIESALNQDYDNFEIIIGDDCSDDNTPLIIRTFIEYPQIKYFRNKERLGRVKNYHNLLYEKAQGEWVVNLDGDDFYTDTTFIRTSIELIESQKNENIVFLQAGHYLSFENGKEEIIKNPNIENNFQVFEGKDYLYNFIKINHFSHLATIYRRKIALNLNFYSAEILSTDMESILRMALTGKVILVKKPIGKWLQHNTNASSFSGFNKLLDNLKWIDNVSNFAILKTNNNIIWTKWRKENLKLQLTGIYIHECKSKNNIEKFKLLSYFWSNYKFLFLYPVFLKKTLDVFLKTNK
jgi:glycosyltransferase involved in cell wall biosynthesis